MKDKKELYHWCMVCKDIVAKKKNEPLFVMDLPNLPKCKCVDKNWKRIYLTIPRAVPGK